MKVTALINRAGGGMANREPDAFREELAQAFESRGIEADLVFTGGDQLTTEALKARDRAGGGNASAVVVGGGDGSIRSVAEVLAGSGVAMGVLPLGTLNHFSKDLGIPQTIPEAVDVIAAGNIRVIDAARVNDDVFINNSSVGLYPHLVADRDRRVETSGVSKRLATLLAAVRIARRWPVRRVRVTVEGRREQFSTSFVFVGNNAYDLATLGNRMTLDSGQLWTTVVKQPTRYAFMRLLAAVFLRVTPADLEVIESASVRVSSRASRLFVSLDGEVRIMRPPLQYASLPGALRVFAPPPKPA